VDSGDSAFDRVREPVERPLWRLFGEYGLGRVEWLTLGLAANLVSQTASLVPPVVLGSAIDAVFSKSGAAYTLPFVPTAWLPTGAEAQFWFSAALIVGAFLARAAFGWVYGVAANEFAHDVMHDVRTDSFEAVTRLDMAFFDDKRTGEVMSVLNNDTSHLETFLDDALMNSLRLVVMVGGIAAVLFRLNPQLAAVTLVAVPAMAAFTWWFMRVIAPRYRARQSAVAAFNTRLENGISGVELAKTTGSEAHEVERVTDASYAFFRRTMGVLRLSYLYRPGMELLAGLSFAATFVVGGYWLLVGEAPLGFSGSLSVGVFVTFVFMTQRFVAPLAEVSSIVDQVENARASAERIFGLADLPVRVTDAPDAEPLRDPDGRVEYDGVSFGYETYRGADGDEAAATADGGVGDAVGAADAGDEPVLRDASFTAEPGETVGVVGSTGAGKSTLVKLLLRLYDVDGGAVRVDGRDVREVTHASLRRAVGYVGQDTFLFDGTIADNVRYGRFDVPDDAVRDAARAADAHEFIAELPDGYETRVGERGVKLSGGQRQRIALARVFLHDPPMLVLDEATSDVDTETEQRIQASLHDLAADRTTLVVAHRLSTVVDADEILVMADGEIIERGTHEELVEAGGRYADLWRAQTGTDDLV
jgi:ATP-binding cassette subfamily B protein